MAKLYSFEGRARIIIELPGEGYSGTSKVYVNLPDSVFVKTEAILGIDIGALFLDRRVFGAYAPRENVLYYGETDRLDLRDFLQLEIETDELVENLTGLTQVVIDSSTRLTLDGDKFLITCQLGDEQQLYWVDARKPVVTRSERRGQNGELILSKEYRRFKMSKGIVLPQIVKVTRPGARERLTIYYTSQKINKEIDPEKFRLKTASNAKRVYWRDAERVRDEKRQSN